MPELGYKKEKSYFIAYAFLKVEDFFRQMEEMFVELDKYSHQNSSWLLNH